MSVDRMRRELEKLREERAASRPCRTCAQYPMYTTWVSWEQGEEGVPRPEDPDPCPGCGRTLEIVGVGWEETENPAEADFVVVYREMGHTGKP